MTLARFAALMLIALALGLPSAFGQLNQNCTVSVLNRTVSVNPDGSWVLPNIPANYGQVKARATCTQNGVTTFGESGFFTVTSNSAVNLPSISMGTATPIPVSLAIGPTASPLTATGQTLQLAVTATYPDGSSKDVTASSTGTNYTISNTATATVSVDGLVTGVSSGTVVIQADNDGATGITSVTVVLGGSSHGGIPDSWAIAHGLNPNDPFMPMEDPDRDGLTNLQEFQTGTDPNNPDTDGDGLNDGDDLNVYHTNPLLPDTDGDLIPDGVEVKTSTNPLDPQSYDLQKATATSTLTPSSFVLATSLANPVLSIQLNWKVLLIDGKTTLDLTADPRTSYSSSNLNICSFGVSLGTIFSGAPGNCVITVKNSTLTVTVPGSVSNFAPAEIATLGVNGAVAVDVGGNFAYVAAGTNGLTVVDITDRIHPVIRGTLAGLGNAVAVRVAGQYLLVADANGFLDEVQSQNPDAPALITSLPISGSPLSLAVHGNLVAVAAQSGGVSLVSLANPVNPTLISTLALSSSAVGVDFDAKTGIGAVAMGTGGLQVVDLSIPAAPKVRGLLAGGDVRRTLVRYPAVLLADAQRSVSGVDLTNPDSPTLTSSMPANLGGVPVDIAAYGNVAMTADTTFGRAVPIIDISNPLSPASLAFWTLLSPGFSSSVAVDNRYGYLVIPNTLRILQYQNYIDTYGLPPNVAIMSPVSGIPVIQGQTITVSSSASDDVAVASVSFYVDSQVEFTTPTPPYVFTFTVPSTATTLTLGAAAVDFGGNVGTAMDVTVPVIPDSGTTVIGTVIDTSGNPIAGATVTATGARTSSTLTDGTFSISGVPTIIGNVSARAAFNVTGGVVLGGVSASIPPVVSGITNVGTITVIPEPTIAGMSRLSALAGSVVTFKVTGATLTNSITFAFQPTPSAPATIQTNSVAVDGTSAFLTLTSALGAQGTFALVGTTSAGTSSSTITPAVNRFTLVSPSSTADTDGDGYSDVMEAEFGTDPLEPNSYPVYVAPTVVDSPSFSALNTLGPTGALAAEEVDAVTFSVLNESGSAAIVGAGEADTTTFSVLNTAKALGTSSTLAEADGAFFSLLNTLESSGAVNIEADSLIFSVNNLAAAAAARAAAFRPPTPLDSDGDGYPDDLERALGSDPFDPKSVPEIHYPPEADSTVVSVSSNARPKTAMMARPSIRQPLPDGQVAPNPQASTGEQHEDQLTRPRRPSVFNRLLGAHRAPGSSGVSWWHLFR